MIARCIVIWPNHPIPSMSALKVLWQETLADLPYPAVQAAVAWWIADEEDWFPKPGNIRERAEHLLPGGIVRHDSYAFRVRLDRAVEDAVAAGTPLDLMKLSEPAPLRAIGGPS